MGSLASPGSVRLLTAVSIRSVLLTTTMKSSGLAYTVIVFNVIAAKFSTNNDMFITGRSRPCYCTVILYHLHPSCGSDHLRRSTGDGEITRHP